MLFSVIIATFGYMLNAMRVTHKYIRFYKKAQQSGTVLNALRKYIRFQTSEMKNFLKLIKGKT